MVTDFFRTVGIILSLLTLDSCKGSKPVFFSSAYSLDLATRMPTMPDPVQNISRIEIYEFPDAASTYYCYDDLAMDASRVWKTKDRIEAQKFIGAIRHLMFNEREDVMPSDYRMSPKRWHVLVFSESGSIAYWRVMVMKEVSGEIISQIFCNPESTSFYPIHLDWDHALELIR